MPSEAALLSEAHETGEIYGDAERDTNEEAVGAKEEMGDRKLQLPDAAAVEQVRRGYLASSAWRWVYFGSTFSGVGWAADLREKAE